MGKINNRERKKKKETCVKPAIDVQNEATKNDCAFCHQPRLEGNEVERAGNLYKLGNRYYHYFCVLFCQKVDQNGEDDEGLKGFLKDDIEKGLASGKFKKCCYCGRKGATLKCNKVATKSKDACSKKYHFPCALRQKTPHTFIFSGTMDSFCPVHRPKQRYELKVKDKTCLGGCQEKIDDKDERIMISPCCGRKYHLSCIQEMASASGRHHFKCPACSVKEEFLQAALDIGIYVPDQDAAWEKDSFYDFESQGRLYQRCDAKVCKCPKGREHHLNGSKFEIVRCESCGCGGIHISCGNLLKQSPLYICDKHSNNERQMLDHIESVKRTTFCGSEDENSDEDESFSNNSTYKPISSGTVIRKTPASEYSTSVFPSDDEDSDYEPDDETTETTDTERNKLEVQNISSNETSNIASNEESTTQANETIDKFNNVVQKVLSNGEQNARPSNLIESDSILIDDSESSSESDDNLSQSPRQIQDELTKLFQQSKQSPIKTYQGTNHKPFALLHPTTHKKVALQPACSISHRTSAIKHNKKFEADFNLPSSNCLQTMQGAVSSSLRENSVPPGSVQSTDNLNKLQQPSKTNDSGYLIDSEEGQLPTIEMTFSMAYKPQDFPVSEEHSSDPDIVTTKIIGFETEDVVEIESDDEIVCIDDGDHSYIDYRPREDTSNEVNYTTPSTSSKNIEPNTVVLD